MPGQLVLVSDKQGRGGGLVTMAAFLTEADAKGADLQHRIDAHIAASDAFIAKHGSLADEFGKL